MAWSFFGCFLAACSVCICFAMVEKDITVHMGHEIRTLQEFEFSKNGVMAVTFHDNSQFDDLLHIYHCSEAEMAILSKYNTMNNLCANLPNFHCSSSRIESSTSTGTDAFSFKSLRDHQWMSLIAINCNSNSNSNSVSSANRRISFTIVALSNPEGEYLSLSMLPFKQMYIYLGMAWLIIGSFWFLHFCLYGYVYRYYNNRLQNLCMLCPLFACLHCILEYAYWMHSSTVGVESLALREICCLSVSVNYALLALLSMFIVEGWSWMYYSLANGNLQTQIEIYGVAALLFAATMMQNIYPSTIIVTIVVCILVVRRLVAGYTKNMTHLFEQKSLLLDEISTQDEWQLHDCHSHSPIADKIRILKYFQRGLIGFVTVWLLIYWSQSLLSQLIWLSKLIQEILVLCLVVYSGWCLKLNVFEPHIFVPGTRNHYFSLESVHKHVETRAPNSDQLCQQCFGFAGKQAIIMETDTGFPSTNGKQKKQNLVKYTLLNSL